MDKIDARKKLRSLIRRAEEKAKFDKCVLCGKPQSSFCNSHSIPQMVLKTIATKGKLLQPGLLMDSEIFDNEKGINSTGTFHFICRECDGKYFKTYEDPKNLLEYPSDKIMAEIALKNMLLMLSKRYNELALFDIVQDEEQALINKEIMDEDKNLDIRDYSGDMDLYKKIIENDLKGGFRVLFWEKLPYVTPIATQTPITIYKDMEGTILNDIYDPDHNKYMESVHLCVFPIDMETIVLLFHHKKDKSYRRLWHQLNSISKEKRIQYINYLIFAYTENYYFSKEIEPILKNSKYLQLLSREANGISNFGITSLEEMIMEPTYVPITPEQIPNFLSEQYKLV